MVWDIWIGYFNKQIFIEFGGRGGFDGVEEILVFGVGLKNLVGLVNLLRF